MKKFMKLIMAILLIFALLTGCTGKETSKVTSDSLNKAEIKTGNTLGNMVNGGFVVQEGGWVYYISNESSIYKVKVDGSEKTILFEENKVLFNSINLAGGWIYFSSISTDENHKITSGGIYKIKTDGKEKVKLCPAVANYLYVAGDWLYYINMDNDHSNLERIKIDGSEKTKISEEIKGYYSISGDFIYYILSEDKNNDGYFESTLCRIKTDGTGLTRVSLKDSVRSDIQVLGDWVYYGINSKVVGSMDKEGDDHTKLYKIKTDGTGKTKISDDYIGFVNISGDCIYYSNMSDNLFLYKMKIDGTGKTKLNNQYSVEINVAGDWIYYMERSAEVFKLYKLRQDGSERTEIKN